MAHPVFDQIEIPNKNKENIIKTCLPFVKQFFRFIINYKYLSINKIIGRVTGQGSYFKILTNIRKEGGWGVYINQWKLYKTKFHFNKKNI